MVNDLPPSLFKDVHQYDFVADYREFSPEPWNQFVQHTLDVIWKRLSVLI
jgi:hypothetical protein